MKREIRSAVSQGIKEAEKNGYKWTITADGLKWSYCDEEFTFKFHEYEDGDKCLSVHQKGCDEAWIVIIIDNSRWADTNSVEDAYRIATKATIAKANRLY